MKTLLGVLCSSLLSAAAPTWVDRSPTTPHSYYLETRNIAATNPIWFAGATGTSGGIDPLLIPFFREKAFLHGPRTLAVFSQLMKHIHIYGGSSKNSVVNQIKRALASNTATPFMFAQAMLQGMRPAEIDPKTITFLEHTIIRNEFNTWRNLDLAKLVTGQTTLPFLRVFEPANESSVSAIPYFGGVFGLTTHLEMFCNRLAIIAIPSESYFAHGYTFDPFSAILHDIVHTKQTTLLDDILGQVTRFLHNQYLAAGGSTQNFKQFEQNTLYLEQTRFLNMLLRLNSEAFRRWGLSATYKKFALGLFLMTHEMISFTAEMIYSNNFIGSFSNMIDLHIKLVQSMPVLSPEDILQTDPGTGISALTHLQIQDLLIQKYFDEEKRKNIKTTTITLNNGDFHDMDIELTNGEKLFFTEPTLSFKRKNYADTRNLMRIAGISLPEIRQSDDAGEVQFVLGLAIYVWGAVMIDLKEKVTYLAETTIDESGRSLSRFFFDGRFRNVEALIGRLQRARGPNHTIAHDYRR